VTAAVQNRRAHHRYAIEAKLEYRSVEKGKIGPIHQGLTVNLSRQGVLFLDRDHSTEVGSSVRLTIALPIEGRQLHAVGTVVRVEGDHVAVEFARCSFEAHWH